MQNLPMNKPRERSIQRKALSGELHFTHKQLLRMLPTLARRVEADRTAPVLSLQCEQDRRNQARLVQLALDHGQPPGPRLCAEASARVHQLYHVDRSIEDRDARSAVVVNTLLDLRAYLLSIWGKLIEVEPLGVAVELHNELIALQSAAAEQHRELVLLIGSWQNVEAPSAVPLSA